MKEDIHIGGQAVIEGVLMRCKDKIAIAVRKPNKTIKVKKESIKSITKKYKWLKWPFFRGIVNMYEMLVIGMRALTYSAEQQATKKEKITKKEGIISVTIAIILTILLFVALPLFLTKLIVKSHGILFNLIDGVIRIVIFILYIYLISKIKDIKRIFQYHGAEHKAVNCYEDRKKFKKLTPENCQKYSTLHTRCGTSFLLFVLVISILIFSLITHPNFLVKFFGRLLLLPVIIGIGYEFLKFSSKFRKNRIIEIIVWPGLALQKMTTANPTKKQLEVAIAALKSVIK